MLPQIHEKESKEIPLNTSPWLWVRCVVAYANGKAQASWIGRQAKDSKAKPIANEQWRRILLSELSNMLFPTGFA